MSANVQELLDAIRALPLREQAELAAALLASLDGKAGTADEVEAAWAAEVESRARRALAGTSDAVPWDDVRACAEAALRGQ